MLISYKRGQGSIVLRVKVLNSSVATGAGLTGLTSASAGLIIGTIADNEATTTAYTQAGGLIETIAALGTYAAPTATKCRFKEVDATNHPGVYEIQLADARYAISNAKSLLVSVLGATNVAETDATIPLRDLDPYATGKNAVAKVSHVQLLARSDEAIETDNATELSAINNDEGSGAGDFMNETEALEALRDRGDLAWLTGGSGGSTESYTTTDWTRTIGDNDGGAGADTVSVNGAYFATGEVNAGTFLEVDATFTIGAGETAKELDFWGFYDGGGSHTMTVLALDVSTAIYEPIGSIGLGEAVGPKETWEFSPGHTNQANAEVKVKFLHTGSASGIPSHVFNVDKAQVNSSLEFTTADKTLAYFQLGYRKDAAIANDRSTELGEINIDQGTGAGAYDNADDSQEAGRDRGDTAWITATGFSTHSAADVYTAFGDGSQLTTLVTATGFSTHSAADVYTAFGTGSNLTALVTATGFNVVVPDVAGTAATLLGLLETHGDSTWATATGFNTVVPPSVAQFNARTIVSADYFVVGDYTAPDNSGISNIEGIVGHVTYGNSAILTQGNTAWITATGFLTDKTGFSLSATGLDAITDWTVDLAGSLTGSVGSVTGAVGSVAAAVTTDSASRIASKADVSALALEASLSDGSVTLDSAYDAAKTAAQAGDKMDLVDDAVDGDSLATAAVTEIVAGFTADGVAWADFATSTMACLFGIASVSGSTVTFKERDGVTTKLTVTYDTVGNRTLSTMA